MAEQHAEQAGADEAGGKPAEQSAAEQAAGRQPGAPGRPAVAALPGCVIERWIGAAVLGAVRVAGGAENVRVPRLPPEKPPPARALRIGGNEHKRGRDRGKRDQPAVADHDVYPPGQIGDSGQ